MKVLEITVRADIGGGPKHTLDLIQNLDSNLVQPFLASPSTGEYIEALKESSRGHIDIPFRKFSLISFVKLLSFCKRNEIKIVHSHGRGAGLYSRLMKPFGFKIIHTFHGIHTEEGFSGRIKLILDKVLKPLTDSFICVSNSEKKKALKHNVTDEKKTVVIANGVSIPSEYFTNPQNQKIKLGTLSRLSYAKGLDILLNYVQRFEKETGRSFEFLIGGSGELKENLLQEKKSDQIEFVGNVEPQAFLDSLNCYISFSRWEGLPIAVMEAMAKGKPCLISDVEGNRDLINDQQNGFLFDLESYDTFKAKLLQLLESEPLREKFGEAARKKVIYEFSIQKMIKNITDLYESNSGEK